MLTEDLNFIPYIHTARVTAPCNSSSRGSAVFFGLAAGNCSVGQTQTYTLDFKRHNFLKCLFCITFLLTCFFLNLTNYQFCFKEEDKFYLSVELLLSWKQFFMALLKISCDLNHLIYLCEPYLMF